VIVPVDDNPIRLAMPLTLSIRCWHSSGSAPDCRWSSFRTTLPPFVVTPDRPATLSASGCSPGPRSRSPAMAPYRWLNPGCRCGTRSASSVA
jgi:hypothetical protein